MSKKQLTDRDILTKLQSNQEDDDDDDDEEDDNYEPDKNSSDDEEEEDVASDEDDEEVDESESKNVNKLKRKLEEKKVNDDKIPEIDTKKVEDIWSSFLKDVNSTKKPTETSSSVKKIEELTSSQSSASKTEAEGSKFKKFFSESAVSEIKKVNNVPEPSKIEVPANNIVESKKPRPSGLAGILGKIDKKAEPSTLLKSKLDWDEYKKNEEIEEDLNIHSKGKQSYLERQAFLGRVDMRQFEIEKNFRTKDRAKKN